MIILQSNLEVYHNGIICNLVYAVVSIVVGICDSIGYWDYLILRISVINDIRYYNVRIRLGKGLDDIILVLVDGY